MTAPARTITMVPLMATPRRAEGLGGQVWHLLSFDLLRLRWWLVAYAAVVGVAALHALEVSAFAVMHPVLLALGVPLFTMLCAVVLVQGDHPSAPDAFWRGKPISPWAQAAAKLLLLAGLVALPTLTLVVVLSIMGTPAATIGTLAGASAMGLLPWAVLALAIGAVTRDLRSAPLVLVAALGLAFSTRTFGGLAALGPWWVADLEALVVIAGGCALVAGLYRSVLSARAALAVTVLLGVAAIDSATREVMVLGRPPAPPADAAAVGAAGGDPERLVIDTIATGDQGDGPFAVTYHVANARPDARYGLQRAQITVRYATGDSARLTMVDGGVVEPSRAALPVPAGTRWSSGSDSLPQQGTMMAFVITREMARRPASDIRRIEVHGNLRRMLVRDSMSAPWVTGDVYRASAQRLRLFDTVGTDGRLWQLRWSEPHVMAETERARYGDLPNDLVNSSLVRIDRDGVAHPIARRHIEHANYPLVLPWTVRRQETLVFGSDNVFKSRGIPADVAGSRLHVVRWRTAAVVPVQADYQMARGVERPD